MEIATARIPDGRIADMKPPCPLISFSRRIGSPDQERTAGNGAGEFFHDIRGSVGLCDQAGSAGLDRPRLPTQVGSLDRLAHGTSAEATRTSILGIAGPVETGAGVRLGRSAHHKRRPATSSESDSRTAI